jgi:hypothetical protein
MSAARKGKRYTYNVFKSGLRAAMPARSATPQKALVGVSGMRGNQFSDGRNMILSNSAVTGLFFSETVAAKKAN